MQCVFFLFFKAGLAAFSESITKEDAFDHKKMAEIIARQKPNWIPGEIKLISFLNNSVQSLP